MDDVDGICYLQRKLGNYMKYPVVMMEDEVGVCVCVCVCVGGCCMCVCVCCVCMCVYITGIWFHGLCYTSMYTGYTCIC